jgi:putative ABC transport system permease protein
MAYKQPNSRSIFWRLCLRSVQVRRPQALLAIGSLIVGAAVSSLLLNLYGGVQRKMTESFSSFGANVILAPHSVSHGSSSLPSVMPQPSYQHLGQLARLFPGLASIQVLYAVVRIGSSGDSSKGEGGQNVVAVGTDLPRLWRMYRGWRLQATPVSYRPDDCAIGRHLAYELQLHVGDELTLRELGSIAAERADHSATCTITAIVSTGAAEDNQVFVPLNSLQQLTNMRHEVSTVELRLPGNSKQIERAISRVAALFPGTDVRPVRQIVYSEAKVLGTLSRLMLALTVLILIIIALCVMATMTSIVIERRKDIALMKALGASDRVVMEFFLSEGAALGLLGGLAGFGLGAVLARDVALRLFHVALAPSGWVFPLVCLSSVALAVAATLFPVQMVRRVQPAVALKGA